MLKPFRASFKDGYSGELNPPRNAFSLRAGGCETKPESVSSFTGRDLNLIRILVGFQRGDLNQARNLSGLVSKGL